MTAACYFDLVREMKNAYNHRLRLVESAHQRGIKPTARLFTTTVPTIHKWLRRHRQAHQTPIAREAQLVELRKALPTRRLAHAD
jgi:transposase-like protein